MFTFSHSWSTELYSCICLFSLIAVIEAILAKNRRKACSCLNQQDNNVPRAEDAIDDPEDEEELEAEEDGFHQK